MQSGGDPVQTGYRAQFHGRALVLVLRRWNVSQITVLDRWTRLCCCPRSPLALYHCHHSPSLSLPTSLLSMSFCLSRLVFINFFFFSFPLFLCVIYCVLLCYQSKILRYHLAKHNWCQNYPIKNDKCTNQVIYSIVFQRCCKCLM